MEYIGAIQDVTARRLSEQALERARSDLAHVARVATLGALTASIAHEVNQPLSGIITNAGTCLRMLDTTPPDVDGARETARRTIRDGNRASDVITRLRSLFSKKDFTLEPLDLNEATREVIALSLSELQRNRVIVQSELADDLPSITGDRVQLQQVLLNLLRNASDAMVGVDDRPRQLLIRTESEGRDHVRVTVRDAGVGIERQGMDKLFDAFYTTKSGGMGIGLSVSRSIVERHRGRLWAEPNDGPGATFAFSIPRTSATGPEIRHQPGGHRPADASLDDQLHSRASEGHPDFTRAKARDRLCRPRCRQRRAAVIIPRLHDDVKGIVAKRLRPWGTAETSSRESRRRTDADGPTTRLPPCVPRQKRDRGRLRNTSSIASHRRSTKPAVLRPCQ